MNTSSASVGTRRAKPEERRQQVVLVATTLFHRSGYHGVSMNDVAEQIGITAAALYRYFGSKADMLSACLENSLDKLETTLDEHPDDLDGLLDALTVLATTEYRRFGLLLARETRHLPPHNLVAVRKRVKTVHSRFGKLLDTDGVSPSAQRLRIWALFSVFSSTSYYRMRLSPRQLHPMLYRISRAVASCELADEQVRVEQPKTGIARLSRRENILQAAMSLFNERSYNSVSMEEIGAAAGISSALVYHYFDDKIGILYATQLRGAEALAAVVRDAFALADSPRAAADRLAEGYAEFAVENRGLMDTLITAVPVLPDTQRQFFRARQYDFVDEWSELLSIVHPELSTEQSRSALYAALTIVHNAIRSSRILSRPQLAEDLTRLVRAALDAAPAEA